MKRFIFLSVLLTVFSVLSWSVNAATVDLAPYMALTPGKWSIMQDLNTGTLHGSVTLKGTNGQIICTYYINNGSGWTFDTSTVLKITPTAILMIGSYDGTDLWATLPTVTIPRRVTLNQPYYYNGIMKNQRTHVTKPFTQIVRVTKTGLTVHTSGGTFTNCIMFQNYEYSPGSSDIVTILYAQGRAEVERWGCAIQDRGFCGVDKHSYKKATIPVTYTGGSNLSCAYVSEGADLTSKTVLGIGIFRDFSIVTRSDDGSLR